PAITQLSIPRPVDQGTEGPGILWTTSRADSGRRAMSLIASVLHLDRRAEKALRITDPYSPHRVIYSLYPDVRSEDEKKQSQASGILYADQGGDHRGRKILMSADRQPASRVENQYGEVRCKPLPPGFLEHSD